MNAEENKILGLPRRPRVSEPIAATLVGGLLGAVFGGPGGAVIGGLAANVLAKQPQPLEAAVREYFAKKNLEVVFFHRAPKAIKVTFRSDASTFWTVQSVIPDDLSLSPEDIEDWLYGNLVKKALPQKIRRIKALSVK